MKNNNVRSSTKSFVVSQRAITLKTLHKVELLRYRACGEQYILNDDRLVFHLLAFIDVCEDGSNADQPLFSTCNDSIVIDRNYKFCGNSPRSLYNEEHLINIAKPYFSTHVAVHEIVDFADKLKANKSLPAFWEVFLAFIREFLADYRRALSKLRESKKLCKWFTSDVVL
ncbi:hypothetical protein COOONC_22182 [Cooperia oncophora]